MSPFILSPVFYFIFLFGIFFTQIVLSTLGAFSWFKRRPKKTFWNKFFAILIFIFIFSLFNFFVFLIRVSFYDTYVVGTSNFSNIPKGSIVIVKQLNTDSKATPGEYVIVLNESKHYFSLAQVVALPGEEYTDTGAPCKNNGTAKSCRKIVPQEYVAVNFNKTVQLVEQRTITGDVLMNGQ